jgi:hypothetical protein
MQTGTPRRSVSFGGFTRSAIVVFGALVALQSSANLDAVKLAYFAAALLALISSVYHVWQLRRSALARLARNWLIASAITAVLIAISLPVALVHGTPITAWVRDAAGYGLIAAAPWLALDLASSVPPRAVLAFTVIAGALATSSFTINWIHRRALADLPFDRLVLPSFALATMLFAVAVAHSLASTRARYLWSGAAAFTVALLLFSGTRTTLAILIIPPVTLASEALANGRKALQRGMLPALLPILFAVAIVVRPQLPVGPNPLGTVPSAAPAASPSSAAPPSGEPAITAAAAAPTPTGTPSVPYAPTAVPDAVAERYESITEVLAGRDPSLRDRLAQTKAAWDVFLASPLVGSGLGVSISWVDTEGHPAQAFTADTPVVILAKFGGLGLVLVGALGWAAFRSIKDPMPGVGSTHPARLSILGFTSGLLALTPFGAQLEDKGTGLAIILLLAFAWASTRDVGIASETPSAVTTPPAAE